MPEFRYSVVDANGQLLTGVIEAENQEVCRKIIAQRGLFCLSVSPVSLASRSISFGSKTKLDSKGLSVFCREFSTMLTAGIGVIKALDILHQQAASPWFQSILKKVYESVQRGQSLSASLKAQSGTFPDLMIHMIEAGEASGTLDQVMERMAEHFEKNAKIQNKVKNAMIYPMVLGILTVCVVILLMIFVLPVFIKMFESSGTPLPLPTRILIGISNSLTQYWYVYVLVIASAAIVWINFLKSKKGRLRWDLFKLQMPVLGKLNMTVISSRFARTLSTMMQSGIPLLKSLEITAAVLGNQHVQKVLSDIGEDIRRGVPLSISIRKANIFPIMLTSMISIGEESGALDSVLYKTAGFYDEEADSAISKMVGLLEPLMIIIMALIVGFIVVSIIVPMFGMMGAVE